MFTLSGGHVMPIYEGCRLEGVRVIDVRHEQSAAHAAEAWGRFGRACGVAVVTAGPGVTGHGHGRRERTGRPGAARRDRRRAPARAGGARRAAGVRPARDCCDRSPSGPACARTPSGSPSSSRSRSGTRSRGRAGPVYLELPMDVLFEEAAADRPPGRPARTRARVGGARRVERAAELLRRCGAPRDRRRQRHLVGRRRGRARLARATTVQAPVFLNGSGRGVAAARPSAASSSTREERRSRRRTSSASSARRSTSGSRYGAFATRALIHVHADPDELGRNRAARRRARRRLRLVLDALPGRSCAAGVAAATTGASAARRGGRAPGGTSTAPRSSRTPPRSTTTGSAPSSTACSTPAPS